MKRKLDALRDANGKDTDAIFYQTQFELPRLRAELATLERETP